MTGANIVDVSGLIIKECQLLYFDLSSRERAEKKEKMSVQGRKTNVMKAIAEMTPRFRHFTEVVQFIGFWRSYTSSQFTSLGDGSFSSERPSSSFESSRQGACRDEGFKSLDIDAFTSERTPSVGEATGDELRGDGVSDKGISRLRFI